MKSTISNFKRKANKFSLDSSGKLKRNGLPVVKFAERQQIFNTFHEVSFQRWFLTVDLEHRGRDSTHTLIKERYYWQGGYAYIAKKTKSCIACSYKRSAIKYLAALKLQILSWPAIMPPLKAIPVMPQVMWRIHIDILQGTWNNLLISRRYFMLEK